MSEYKTVIGLEIHAELLTKTKIFCNCSAEFGGAPNTRCCPVCTGMPGTLPIINQTAVEYAVKAGYALGCEINKFSVFDRKNYFYPDLPKAYQISQLYYPIIGAGAVTIEVGGKKKDIRINHIHLEEDAGKLVHDDFNGVSLADYNRCGIPLIEIVTEPDMSSAEEAMAFVEQISLLLQYAGVCDCKMEQGSLRCDVNISIMKPDAKEFGTRAEIKNINSIKSVGRAIKYEERRQALLVDAGKKVVQETRRYDANRDKTTSMRSKENANDYRYFPEPDILQVNLTDEQLSEIKAKLPELPNSRFEKYTKQYGLSAVDANILIQSKIISDFFEDSIKCYNNPKSISVLILGEFMRRVNLGEIDPANITFTPSDFAELAKLADEEKVSGNDAKKIFRIMVEKGGKPEDIAKENGMLITIDTDKANSVIDEVLSANSSQVAQYVNGEQKVFGFIMGQCTKALKGVATPKVIKEILDDKLKALSADAATAKSEEQSEEQTVDISKLTAYVNEDKYVPEKKDNFVMVSPEKLKKEITIGDILDNIGKEVEFTGTVHRVRKYGSISFVVIRTAFSVIQTVYSADNCKDSIVGVKEGQFVYVKGTVSENTKDYNGVEVVLSEIRLISAPKYDYPLKISQGRLNCTIDVNLDNRSVSLRNPYEKATFRLQEGIVHGMHKFMQANHFTEIHSPKIVAQGAEGGDNIFKLDYFQKNEFLNQSPQFYKQAMVGVFNRVYEIAPVYRAEKHATSRHLNEYIGLDFEMGFIDSMYDVMAMETAMLKYICDYLRENYADEIRFLGANIPVINEIPSIKFIDAITMLRGDNGGTGKKFDLDPEDEVNLCKYAKEKYDSDFIFVTHFPSSKPPFYAMNSREDPREAYKFDLLFRGLEITSGGQRIHDYDEQVQKMLDQGLDPKDFESYLEAHKYGLPPHGGLGIGLERLLMKMLELSNVRETSLFPRDINRLMP